MDEIVKIVFERNKERKLLTEDGDNLKSLFSINNITASIKYNEASIILFMPLALCSPKDVEYI